ncbi:WD40-repeat containing protein, partial [Chondrus crispus]
ASDTPCISLHVVGLNPQKMVQPDNNPPEHVPGGPEVPRGPEEIQQDDDLPQFQEDDAEEVIVLDSADPNQPNHDVDDLEQPSDDINVDGTDAADAEVDGEEMKPLSDDAILVFQEHTSETLAVAASPVNKNIVITGGMDDIGLIWDLELQQSIAKVDGAKDSVSTVAFSHDGRFAAFGSENGAISIVLMDGSTANGTPLDGPGDTIHFLSWHPRGPVLLAGSSDSVAYMWNAAKGSFMMAFAGHEDAVSCGTFSADGKLVITASLDTSVRIWNPTTGATVRRIQTGIDGLRGIFHGADILCLDVGGLDTSASNLIASGCAAGDVFVTHRGTGQIVRRLSRHEGGVESVAFSPELSKPVLLATAGGDGIVRVWDVELGTERCKFTHGGVIAKVVWHPTLPVLVSASSDGSIVLWNALSGQQMRKLEGHESFISDVCFAGGNKFISSTSGDGSVRVFDVRETLETAVV